MYNYYLKPDKLTNGVISKILENSWRNNPTIAKVDLKKIHQVLVEHNIFGEVAENIFVPVFKEKEKIGEKLLEGIQLHIDRGNEEPENKVNHVSLFPQKGFVLKDGIYGAAFGRFKYVYRSKGIRIFWFESGLIEYRAVYSTIDKYGFQYTAEEFDGCNIFDDIELDDIMHSPLNEAFGNGKILISNLAKIKKDFVRDYPIEYLLYPPDVEELSSFSVQLREQIWDSIIELIKELALNMKFKDERSDLINFLTDFMEEQSIQPNAYHIISLFDFYRENQTKINQSDFAELLSIIRKQSSPIDNTSNPIDASLLINQLEATPKGTENAGVYHDIIFQCLTQIFSGALKRGQKEVSLNEGRKRIDIVFDNHDNTGFFAYIRDRYQIFCPKIFIECKNYSSDPKNPEMDQLLGRFGQYSGKFGILLCREVTNYEKLLQRCKDAMHQAKGHIIFFEDKDIKILLELKKASNEEGIMEYLSNKWDELILNN
ncbi:hypothetical protein PaecuDRAFT_2273 [Paenibacillus curdlanolyticus YK9]|uniref:Restriction endonuclease type IV Mrr domain-containing protein n=1 Tax=Paenibacillus curdlanolyticus YK9 TaxID=717606 RepID=E0I9D6_9BACL|nr:hypothetical protein [Paenibacillus curdlanolyticus]EFM11020.1 hypothetical protein PaecuDRAFT_2273 [Paenibacillus curdlanolyticus YK9]